MGVTLFGTPGPDTLDGTAEDDFLLGLDGDDTLNGLAGDDVLDGGTGDDILTGGADDDVYIVDSLSDVVNEDAGEGFDIVYAMATYVLAASASIERLSSTDHSETNAKDLTGNDIVVDIYGNNGTNVLTGGGANNFMLGFGGTDTLNGLGGADLLFGMDGDDTLNGGAGSDYFDGGAGCDTLNGGDDDDTYLVDSSDSVGEAAGEGFDIVYAASTYVLAAGAYVERLSSTDHGATTAKDLTGNDLVLEIYGNNGVNALTGGAANNLILGFGGDDTLNGLAGADALFGMDGIDILNGGAGNDYMEGGAGTDTLSGGTDNDIYIVASGDTVVELADEGFDAVYATTSYVLSAAARVELLSSTNSAGTETKNLTGNDWVTDVYGNNGINRLIGGALNNTILGLDGNDTLEGRGGNDVLIGGAGVDNMIGGDGDDIFIVETLGDSASDSSSTGGNDIVYASVDFIAGHNIERIEASGAAATTALRLFGSSSGNHILGNAGDNLLDTGMGGSDRLTGFGGADIFNFRNGQRNISNQAAVTGVAIIDDFAPGVDKIRLDTTKFIGLLTGGSSIFEIGATATSASTRILYDPATGNLIWDTDGSAGSPPLADGGAIFGRLQAGLALTFSDFIIEANRAPEANDDNFSMLFTGAAQAIDIGVLGNDFDVDGFGLWMTRIGAQGQALQEVGNGLTPRAFAGVYGSLVGTSNSYQYSIDITDPDTIAIALGQTVTETYVYEVTDGKADRLASVAGFALFDQATFTITITRSADGGMSSTVTLSGGAKDGDASALAAVPGDAKDGAPALAVLDDTVFAAADSGRDALAAHGLRANLDSLAPDLWIV
jgi:Ca2+-binding RTX toxin-like protein